MSQGGCKDPVGSEIKKKKGTLVTDWPMPLLPLPFQSSSEKKKSEVAK